MLDFKIHAVSKMFSRKKCRKGYHLCLCGFSWCNVTWNCNCLLSYIYACLPECHRVFVFQIAWLSEIPAQRTACRRCLQASQKCYIQLGANRRLSLRLQIHISNENKISKALSRDCVFGCMRVVVLSVGRVWTYICWFRIQPQISIASQTLFQLPT